MAAKRILTKIDPTKLVKHPLSLKIYGEKPDPGFDESIKARGVDEPIVVAADQKTIVSGVRRRNGAIKAKIAEVPILVRQDLTDPLDIEEAIIEANRHNEQTMETKTAAFARLKEIETERARKRLATSPGGSSKAPRSNLTEAEKQLGKPSKTDESGRAADKAAATVGMSRNTAEKAVVVVAAIDAADEAGDEETAAELRETLEKSVSKAHRMVVPPKERTKQEKITIERSKLKKTAEALQRSIDDLQRLQPNKTMHDKLLGLASSVIKELPNWK